MKSYIVVVAIAAFLAFYTSFGNNGAWYRDAISTEVVPPYISAYDALANKIIQPLIEVDIEDLNNETVGQTLVNELVQQLSCGIKTMQGNLTEACNDSQAIGTKLDNEINSLVLSISSTENEIAAIQRNIGSLEAQVNQAAEQVRVAEQAVNQKQNEVNNANGVVAEAQRAVDKARVCRGKRSFFRRVFRAVGRVVTQVVIRPVCSLVNMGGIDRAKNRRSLAERELNDARNRLTATQQSLGNLRSVVSNLQSQLTNARNRLQALNNQLNQLRAQQQIISGLSQGLREIVLKIATTFASSTVLQKVIEQLTDFEALIVPLNGVYNSMNGNGFITGSAATVISSLITSETGTRVQNSLAQLKIKLGSMPLNLDAVKAC